MKKTMKLLIASILAIGLFVGCTGDADSNSKPAVVKIEATQAMDTTAFDTTTGGVTKDTEIEAGNTGATMAISNGTVLQDIDGNAITEAPTAKVEVEKSATEAKTVLDFKAGDKRVMPAPGSSIVMSVPAPAGAKPGDVVQIEVPDGIEAVQKLITVIVKADGTVDIRIFSSAFRKTIVIIVRVKVPTDNSTN